MKSGTRNTVQRRLILEIFERNRRPLSPAEVYDLARKELPQIGIATVYRAIRQMLSDALLSTVSIPGDVSYYEINEDSHHHYFHCGSCRRVYVVDACPRAIESMTPQGFTLEKHDLVLHGCCRDCRVVSMR